MFNSMHPDERSKAFVEDFKKQGEIVGKIINNNKDNELFRTAWRDLIEESDTEFEEQRLWRLRERVRMSKANQEWKSIVVKEDKKEENVHQEEQKKEVKKKNKKKHRLFPLPPPSK
jgi:hypothetical protein